MTPNLLNVACASRDILLEHLVHDFVKSSELGWSADLKLLFLLKAQGGSQLLGFPPLRRRVKQDEFGEQKGNKHPLDPLSHKLNVCDASLGDVEVESRVDTGEKRQQTAPQNAGCAPSWWVLRPNRVLSCHGARRCCALSGGFDRTMLLLNLMRPRSWLVR